MPLNTQPVTGPNWDKMVFPMGLDSSIVPSTADHKWTPETLRDFYKSWASSGGNVGNMSDEEKNKVNRWFDYTTKYNTTLGQQTAQQDQMANMNDLQQQNMLGSLNSRGLGRSFLGNKGAGGTNVGGYGSGTYQNLINQQESAKGSTDENYNNLLQSILRGYGDDASKDSSFWTDYNSMKNTYDQQKNSAQANLADYIAMTANLGKTAFSFGL